MKSAHHFLWEYDEHSKKGLCSHAFFTDQPCFNPAPHHFGEWFKLCDEHVVAYLKATSEQSESARARSKAQRAKRLG